MTTFVMVIDDVLVVRAILDTCLQRAGYEVKCFEDGLQALSWLNTAQARIPDLIFVDLGLPRLDGYQIIRLLKASPELAGGHRAGDPLGGRWHPRSYQGAAGRRARLPHQAVSRPNHPGGRADAP